MENGPRLCGSAESRPPQSYWRTRMPSYLPGCLSRTGVATLTAAVEVKTTEAAEIMIIDVRSRPVRSGRFLMFLMPVENAISATLDRGSSARWTPNVCVLSFFMVSPAMNMTIPVGGARRTRTLKPTKTIRALLANANPG